MDDILITGSDPAEISDLITKLHTIFALKDLGKLHYFLGLEVIHISSNTTHLSQTKYVRDLPQRAGMTSAKAMPTPMLTGQKLSNDGDAAFSDPSLYRSIVGGLQYATITRLDISFSANKVSQYIHNPLEVHWKAVKRILRYLSDTIDHGLTFHTCKEFRLLAFCDSDWGSDIDDRKSTRIQPYLLVQ